MRFNRTLELFPDHLPSLLGKIGIQILSDGNIEKAIQEGELAPELHPVSKDAGQGPIYQINLAKIFVFVGEYDKAIDQLELLQDLPQAEFLWQLISIPQLRLDPQWDALRENSRFIQLLEIDE